MLFGTAINCMGGRTQLPVINYLKNNYGVSYVDSITEPGPVVTPITIAPEIRLIKRHELSSSKKLVM